MSKIIDIAQIAIAVLLTCSILLQQRGSGLSEVFGGGGSSYHSRRGFEKTLFILTIILAVVFIAVSLARIFMNV